MASDTCTEPGTQQAGNLRFRRNVFTGELEEVRDNPAEEFNQIREKYKDNYRHFVTRRRRFADPYDNGRMHRCRSISLAPEQATPERIAYENEQARKHGTGAVYDSKGECYLPTRGSRAKEFRRKSIENQASGGRANIVDLDGGYSDHTG